jgi:folylpolyglutamate synthase/dihydropteroate synthase
VEAAGRAGLRPSIHPSVAAAVEAALEAAGADGEVLACGSLVLVGEVHAWVQAQLEAGRLRGGALS